MRVALGDLTMKKSMGLGDVSPCDPSFVGPLTQAQQDACQTANIQQFFYQQGQMDAADTQANLQAGIQYRDSLLGAQSQQDQMTQYMLIGAGALIVVLLMSSGGGRR